MYNLVGDQTKLKSTDDVKKAIIENLQKEIADAYEAPKRVFIGKEQEQEKWIKDICYEILEKEWNKFDDDKSGDLDSLESFEFFSTLVAKPTMEFPGFKIVFRLNDQDGDQALDKQELRDFLVALAGTKKPSSVDILKKTIYDNLEVEVKNNYTAPPKVFSGDDKSRDQWIKLCIDDFIETHWEKYEIRKTG